MLNCPPTNKGHHTGPGASTGCSAIAPLASTPLLCIAFSCNQLFVEIKQTNKLYPWMSPNLFLKFFILATNINQFNQPMLFNLYLEWAPVITTHCLNLPQQNCPNLSKWLNLRYLNVNMYDVTLEHFANILIVYRENKTKLLFSIFFEYFEWVFLDSFCTFTVNYFKG